MAKHSKDCPFTLAEISEFQSMLYNVNTSHKCCNVPSISWYKGYSNFQLNKMEKKSKIDVMHLMIIDRCDHSCKLCCNKKYDISKIPFPTIEDLCSINTLCFTGGEPFLLDRDLDEIAKKFKTEYQNIDKIYVYTSGTALSANFPATLKYIDGVNIAPKNKMDWAMIGNLTCNVRKNEADILSKLKNNRLYVFKDQLKFFEAYKEIPQKLNLQVIHRVWDKEFNTPNNEVFRRLPFLD